MKTKHTDDSGGRSQPRLAASNFERHRSLEVVGAQLTKNQLRVLQKFVNECDNSTGLAEISRERVAFELDMDADNVSKALKDLKKLGFLIKENEGGGRDKDGKHVPAIRRILVPWIDIEDRKRKWRAYRESRGKCDATPVESTGAKPNPTPVESTGAAANNNPGRFEGSTPVDSPFNPGRFEGSTPVDSTPRIDIGLDNRTEPAAEQPGNAAAGTGSESMKKRDGALAALKRHKIYNPVRTTLVDENPDLTAEVIDRLANIILDRPTPPKVFTGALITAIQNDAREAAEELALDAAEEEREKAKAIDIQRRLKAKKELEAEKYDLEQGYTLGAIAWVMGQCVQETQLRDWIAEEAKKPFPAFTEIEHLRQCKGVGTLFRVLDLFAEAEPEHAAQHQADVEKLVVCFMSKVGSSPSLVKEFRSHGLVVRDVEAHRKAFTSWSAVPPPANGNGAVPPPPKPLPRFAGTKITIPATPTKDAK